MRAQFSIISALLLAAVACCLLGSAAAQNLLINCYLSNSSAASLTYINAATYSATSVISPTANYTVCLSTTVSGWNYVTRTDSAYTAAHYAFAGKRAGSVAKQPNLTLWDLAIELFPCPNTKLCQLPVIRYICARVPGYSLVIIMHGWEAPWLAVSCTQSFHPSPRHSILSARVAETDPAAALLCALCRHR